jgi:adenosine deaminase
MSYKVTTKKNLIIFHEPDEWHTMLDRLEKDFGHAIRMRHIMRRELGFTARDHRGLESNRKRGGVLDTYAWNTAPAGYHYEQQVHLDFYNEASQSWFMLKYL